MRKSEEMRRTWDAAAQRGGDVFGAQDRGAAQLAALFERVGAEPSGDGLCLEVGCGGGRMTVELAERWAEVLAVDVSPEMLRHASAAVEARGAANVRFQLVSGTALDGVPDTCADTVVCYGVLQHVPTRSVVAALLKEFARTLKPGGEAFVQLPVLNAGWSARAWRGTRALETLAAAPFRRSVHAARAYRGTRVGDGELDRMLARAGLRVVARVDGPAGGDAATLARYAHAREVVLRLARA